MKIGPTEEKEIDGHEVQLTKNHVANYYKCRDCSQNRILYFTGESMGAVWGKVENEIRENGMDKFSYQYKLY